MIHTVKFNKPVSYTDGLAGVTFTKDGADPQTIAPDSVSGNGTDILEYNVPWDTAGVDPVAGDVVEWQYNSSLGNYYDAEVAESELMFSGDTIITINDYDPSHTVEGKVEITFKRADLSTVVVLLSQANSRSFEMLARPTANTGEMMSRLFDTGNTVQSTLLTVADQEQIASMSWSADGVEGTITLDGTSAVAPQGTSLGLGFTIGADASLSFGFIGVIKEVKAYSDEAGTNLIHHWKINEGQGTNIADSVGTADGVLTLGTGSWSRVGGDLGDSSLTLTNCLDINSPIDGYFQSFGDADALLSASLLTAGDLSGGVITGAGSGGESYVDGITLPRNAYVRYVDPLSEGQKESLATSGQVLLEVEYTGLSNGAPTGLNEDFGFFNGGTSGSEKGNRRSGGTGGLASLYNAALLGTVGLSADGNNSGKSKLHFSWITTGGVTTTDVWVNGMSISTVEATAPYASTDFAELVVGDRGGTLSPVSELKNFQIVDKGIDKTLFYLPYKNVSFYGDSFVTSGQYPTQSLSIIAESPDGSSGVLFDSSVIVYDSGCITTCHGNLNLAGRPVGGNRINCWAEGGTGVYSLNADSHNLATRVDKSLNGTYEYPTVAVIFCGTNDTTGSITNTEITDGTFLSAYQANIDSLKAAGCEQIIICTLPPINVYTAGDTTQLKERDNLINTEIKKVSGVTILDAFTLWGGHDGFDPDDWGTLAGGGDDRHPSRQGQAKLGKWIYQAIVGETP